MKTESNFVWINAPFVAASKIEKNALMHQIAFKSSLLVNNSELK